VLLSVLRNGMLNCLPCAVDAGRVGSGGQCRMPARIVGGIGSRSAAPACTGEAISEPG